MLYYDHSLWLVNLALNRLLSFNYSNKNSLVLALTIFSLAGAAKQLAGHTSMSWTSFQRRRQRFLRRREADRKSTKVIRWHSLTIETPLTWQKRNTKETKFDSKMSQFKSRSLPPRQKTLLFFFFFLFFCITSLPLTSTRWVRSTIKPFALSTL